MTIHLADGNVLIALTVTDHVHHDQAVAWFEADDRTLAGVIGHRQVTDAYLVSLANHFGGKVATLDRGLAALHTDAVTLLAT